MDAIKVMDIAWHGDVEHGDSVETAMRKVVKALDAAGFAIVPVKATEAQLDLGAWIEDCDRPFRDDIEAAYNAMVALAAVRP